MTANPPPVARIRVALVGAGRHAQHHARAILRVPSAELIAIADPSEPARNAIREIVPGIKSFATLDELLGGVQVDVVHICTPPASHSRLAMQALEAGCHIYVEKPFTEQSDQAQTVLELAKARGLSVCAGHQLLFEPPTRVLEQYLGSVGRVAHVESYFSFRTVRHAPGGRRVLRADQQLLDILPHPVYLLLRMLERSSKGPVELAGLQLSRAGTVHALVRRGGVTGVLVVTLEGRPVESFLRVVGTNGALFADYVRGTVQRSIGPGSSGIDKLFAPYRQAWQVLGGSTIAFGRRFLKRQMSYPGLAELFGAFYQSIRLGAASPLSSEGLLDTVRICEQVATALKRAETVELAAAAPRPMDGKGVLLTGGTGFLGKAIVARLLASGRPVRVLARREPPVWDRVAGAEYVAADIAAGTAPAWFEGIDTVIHAAAETAGGWDEHQRNSIDATETILRGSASAGVRRFLHVSSLAVLAKGGKRPISDDDPLDPNSRGSGPYVWGKLESERLATTLGKTLGIDVKVIRPGALVDFSEFDPPGRLGKRLGNFFVAVGSPSQKLGVVDVNWAGAAVAWIADHWAEAPDRLNLLNPDLPPKRDLLRRLREGNPDLTIVWLPTLVLVPLSLIATLLQKTIRPRHPAINVAKVFAVQEYDASRVAALAKRIEERPLAGEGDLTGNPPPAIITA